MFVSNNALAIVGIGKTCPTCVVAFDLTHLHFYFSALSHKNIDARQHPKLKRQRQK